MDQAPFEISVAPMMDWTDRYCRFFLRQIAPHVRLYTEMVSTGAILHGDRDRHLRFSPIEQPLALQLGGNNPAALADAAKVGEDYGYDEINLNCGCPSDRVQNGAFGACLMKDPARVADGVAAMINAVRVPVTVKCRIGVDDCDELPFLLQFIETVKNAGCATFIIHARKAWLNGLSPKENREIPPLRYDIAAAVKRAYPELKIILNGGIKSVAQVSSLINMSSPGLSGGSMNRLFQNTLNNASGEMDPPDKPGDDTLEKYKEIFDGVMIGREAYSNPYSLADIEHHFFNHIAPDRETIARAMIPYMEQQNRDYGTPVKTVARHMLGLYAGQRGGKIWRRILSTEAFKPGIIPSKLINTALTMTQNRDNRADAA